MNMKKILAPAAAVFTAAAAALAAELAGDVEISFKVGDSALSINGAKTEVTAPYVVGDGTTLVPLRVITEAFGAEVSWNGELKSVNLKYPDVDMTIRIGSKTAEVNTHTEALEAAPELRGDTTMVPLRFISETFGATVTYDDDTRLITVTKTAQKELGSTVAGASDKEYIGDSCHGWSMRNPKTMDMTDAAFDRTYVDFSDGTNDIYIDIETREEKIDADTEFNDIRNSLSNATISIADKTNQGDIAKIHFRAKDSEESIDITEYVYDKKLYTVTAYISADSDKETSDELFDIAASFALSPQRDMYDVSNVKDGRREFADDNYKIELSVPSDWTQDTGGSENTFTFYEPDGAGCVSVEIYSKSDTASARSMAEHDRQSHIDVSNKELVAVSELEDGTALGLPAYVYTVTHNGSGSHKLVMKDTFFELGDYIYDFAASGDTEEEADELMSTFSAKELDYDEVGSMLRAGDLGGSGTLELSGLKVTAPSLWKQTAVGALYMITESRTGAFIASSVYSGDPSLSAGDALNSHMNRLLQMTGGTALSFSGTLGGNSGGAINYKSCKYTDKNGSTVYATVYSHKSRDNNVYVFQYSRYDVYYGGCVDKEAERIICDAA